MTNTKSTKRALVSSVISLVLCFAMLLGTTYAWFTDSVTSANNIIKSGNLDIKLEYWDGDSWEDVSGKSDILTNNLWEPGVTEVAYFRIANAGSLALKYQFGINIVEETPGVNVAGESFLLSDYIKFGVNTISADADKNPDTYDSRADAVAAVAGAANKISAGYNPFGMMESGEEFYLALVVWMPEEVGNVANHNGINVPEIKLGINIYATQVADVEEDSFGSDYDEDSWAIVYDENGLKGAIANGNMNVKLGCDITLTSPLVIPANRNIFQLFARRAANTGFVIDFGGYKLTMAAGVDAPAIVNEGALSILNGSVEGAVEVAEGATLSMDADTTVETIVAATAEVAEEIIANNIGATFGAMETPDGSAIKIEDLVGGDNAAVKNEDGSITIVPEEAASSTEYAEGIYKDENKNTYYITNLAGLKTFAADVNSGNNYYENQTVVLSNDIDLKNEEWTPIGSAYIDHGFMGNFDGNGKIISNLSIKNIAVDSDGYSYAGFFGVTEGIDKDKQNFIKNLVIENVTIDTTGHIVAAAIAYPYYTALENITVCGDIAIKGGDYTAGALAYTRRCVDAKNVTVAGNAGSYVTGAITVGGVISDIQMNGGLVANYSNFAVSGLTVTGNKNVGGISGIIAGQTLNGAVVENIKLVCSDARVGIVAGSIANKPVINKATYSNVTGANSIVGAPYDTNDSNGIVIIDGVEYVGNLETIKAKLDAGETTIRFACDIKGDLIIVQPKTNDIDVVIDGNGKTFDGQIAVHGESAANGNDTLLIKNINFVTSKASGYSIVSTDTSGKVTANGSIVRYAHNVTIDNCTFTASGAAIHTAASISFQQAYNITVTNCTATNMHSLVQAQSCPTTTITVEGCKVVNGKNGISLGNTKNAIVKNCVVESVVDYGYGLRVDANGAYNLTVEGCTFNADAPVLLRKATGAYTATFTDTTFVSENGNRILTTAADYEEGKELTPSTGAIKITVDGCKMVLVRTADELVAALESGKGVIFANDIKIDPANMSNAYGKTGINVKNGQTIDGNGYTLDVKGAGGTWDSGINTTGGVIKNITVTGSFRGIFINHTSTYSEKVVLENVTLTGVTYTISCDQGLYQTIEATNCTFNGWTSFAKTAGTAKFVNCSFGEGNGYKYCRPYSDTEFVNCTFCEGYAVDTTRATVTFTDCTGLN